MRKLIPGFFLLIAAASLSRPMTVFALDCVMYRADGPAYISNMPCDITMLGDPLAGDRDRFVRKAALRSVDRGYAIVHAGQFERIPALTKTHDLLPSDALAAQTDTWLKLDYNLHGGRAPDNTRFQLVDAKSDPFQSIQVYPSFKMHSPDVGRYQQWSRPEATDFTPEPGGWVMLITGVLAVCTVARRRKLPI
jgi:hypothetical protein